MARALCEIPLHRLAQQFDIDHETGCWLWTGRTNTKGYPHVWAGFGEARAHRWLYQHVVEPLPSDLELDHLCRNRACINPDHLEPVPHAENVRRIPAETKRKAAIAMWNKRKAD